jgi:hypothetical protein
MMSDRNAEEGTPVATDLETTEEHAGATTPDPPNHGPIQRGYCRLHRTALPSRFPVQTRPDMAVRRPEVVATRSGEELLCNGEHDGPHLWPDGDEAGEWDG